GREGWGHPLRLQSQLGRGIRRADLQGRELLPPARRPRQDRRDRGGDADRGRGGPMAPARGGADAPVLRRRARDGGEGTGEDCGVLNEHLNIGELLAAAAAEGEAPVWCYFQRGAGDPEDAQ